MDYGARTSSTFHHYISAVEFQFTDVFCGGGSASGVSDAGFGAECEQERVVRVAAGDVAGCGGAAGGAVGEVYPAAAVDCVCPGGGDWRGGVAQLRRDCRAVRGDGDDWNRAGGHRLGDSGDCETGVCRQRVSADGGLYCVREFGYGGGVGCS